ncbi:PspA/IM30 family protein [Planctomicrobium sp. SH668]|uniref:PspA/IM30 family protein n=1 Tax=Planctomicrobium sp. SH668 TaxID=3448126 RepID=UPI003F5C75DA
MSWLEQFSLVMRSNITFLREKIEDPERMLQQLVIDMEEELESVRKSVAGAIADEILLKKRVSKARQEVEEWLERTSQALNRNDDERARAALLQKNLAEERADQLEGEHQRQKAETEKLRREVHDMEEKIRQMKQKRTLLLARMNRASSSQKINSALDKATGNSAFAQFSRLESKVEHSEAMAEAFDRLDGRDPDAEELAREFEVEERNARLDQELQQLKSQLRNGANEA